MRERERIGWMVVNVGVWSGRCNESKKVERRKGNRKRERERGVGAKEREIEVLV